MVRQPLLIQVENLRLDGYRFLFVATIRGQKDPSPRLLYE